MIWQFIQSLIRHGLTSAGAIIVTRGLASQSDTDTAAGAVMVLLGFGHSLYVKWKASHPPLIQPGIHPMLMILGIAPLALTFSLFTSGCSTTAQQTAYRSAGTVAVSVDTAMKLWGTYVATSHPPAFEEQAVADAYLKYQRCMAAVCDAGEVYSVATNSVYGTQASAGVALESAVANANQEILDLENLIESFGVKLQTNSTP